MCVGGWGGQEDSRARQVTERTWGGGRGGVGRKIVEQDRSLNGRWGERGGGEVYQDSGARQVTERFHRESE